MEELNRDGGILRFCYEGSEMAYLLQSMNKTKTEESKHEEVKINLSNWKQVSMRRNLVATFERRTKRATGASYT